MKISYDGIGEGALLKALHDNTQPRGMGWLHVNDVSLKQASEEFAEAKKAQGDVVFFDYYHGRPLKVAIDTVSKTFDGRLYDRDAGVGMADAVVADLYASLPGVANG